MTDYGYFAPPAAAAQIAGAVLADKVYHPCWHSGTDRRYERIIGKPAFWVLFSPLIADCCQSPFPTHRNRRAITRRRICLPAQGRSATCLAYRV